MDTEQLLEQKGQLLLLPETFREGAAVKQLMQTISETKRELEDLYFSFGEKHRRLDHLKEMFGP
jgi:hypothetical protein